MKKLTALVAAALLTIFSGVAFASSIKFPIDGFVANPPQPCYFDAEWNENWFGQQPATVYNHNLARIAAIFAEVSYVEVLKKPADNELLGCYKALGFDPKKIEFHYDVDYKNSIWLNDQAAFSIASKQINSARGKRNLIFIIIRGTPLNANEWISNLNISDRTQEAEEFHEGFMRATKQIESALISYLLKNKIDIEDCFLMITGHSRGAAISNLLAAQLFQTELFNTDNIYCYTFASPNVTLNTDVDDPKYGYIWNIVNAEDIVPSVPMNYGGWKYRKYGHIKTLINGWNTDPTTYALDYQTRMNYFFSRLINRKYCPFNLGPFLPIQISAVTTNLNKDVAGYYKGIKAFRYKAEDSLNKMFPEKTPEEEAASSDQDFFNNLDEFSSSTGVIASTTSNFINKQFGVDMSYFVNCFIDMHAMETYLSWILALPEEDVFSDVGVGVIQLYGSCDYAVFSEDKKTLATIMDGKVDFQNIHEPIAASSLFQDCVSIGLPANNSFTVALSKESLLPTKMKLKIQHFTSYGTLIDSTETVKLWPDIWKIYTFKGGHNTVTGNNPDFIKVRNRNAEYIKDLGDLQEKSKFKYWWEVSGATSGTVNVGTHIGSQKIYGSILMGHNFLKPGRSVQLSPGIGHQDILSGRVLIDTELFGDFFYAFKGDMEEDEQRFNFVPSMRISLSFKPKHKMQFFGGVNLDLFIKDFNEAAFDRDYRIKAADIDAGYKFKIVPNIQLGLRF